MGRALDIAERFEEAMNFYQRAVQGRYPKATFNIGFMRRTARGLTRDFEKAAEYYFLTATAALPAGRYRLGWGVESDLEEAVRYHRMAAALGWSNALSNLGKLYADGEGVPQDIDKAVRGFSEATGQGNAYAPYHWAGLLRDGKGVPKDPQRALALYKVSAERGFEWALWAIAEMHRKGALGEPDLAKAYYYYSRPPRPSQLSRRGERDTQRMLRQHEG